MTNLALIALHFPPVQCWASFLRASATYFKNFEITVAHELKRMWKFEMIRQSAFNGRYMFLNLNFPHKLHGRFHVMQVQRGIVSLINWTLACHKAVLYLTIATFALLVDARMLSGLHVGVYGTVHWGICLDDRPCCSWSTHSIAACSLSNLKLVSSTHLSALQSALHPNIHFTCIISSMWLRQYKNHLQVWLDWRDSNVILTTIGRGCGLHEFTHEFTKGIV